MTADFVTIVDAIKADLVAAGITGLSDAIYHLYAPWHPAEGFAQPGETHVGIWPVMETSLRISTHGRELTQEYEVQIWQDARDDGVRLVEDETAAQTFMQMHNDIRARYMPPQGSNQFMGGSDDFEYAGTQFPAGVGLNRVASLRFHARRSSGL